MDKKILALIIVEIFLLSLIIIIFPKEETGKTTLGLGESRIIQKDYEKESESKILEEKFEQKEAWRTKPKEKEKKQGVCYCNSNIYNCDDFSTHAKAQACFEYCGGINNDIHWLDGDDDGIACEWSA